MKIINVVGARPNLMKIAPLMDAYRAAPEIEPLLVHTGQHYDANMSELFFRQLGIPEPDLNLGVGSASHAVQTAEIMRAFEPIVLERRPDAVLVVGDVNSTIACGLVAVKLGVRLVHVEAGLRSFDRDDARGDQPRADRRDQRSARSAPSRAASTICAARAIADDEDPPGRQRDDRHAAAPPRARRGVARARDARTRRPAATPCSRCIGRRTWTTRRCSRSCSTCSR